MFDNISVYDGANGCRNSDQPRFGRVDDGGVVY